MERFVGDVVLKDGSLLHVRRAAVDDQPLLREFLQTLPEKSIVARFLKKQRDIDALLGEVLPKEGRFALVATREGKIVAQAQYELSEPGTADIGVVVSE